MAAKPSSNWSQSSNRLFAPAFETLVDIALGLPGVLGVYPAFHLQERDIERNEACARSRQDIQMANLGFV